MMWNSQSIENSQAKLGQHYIPPGYPTLLPQPPQLSPLMESKQEEPLPVPIFSQAPLNTLSIQQIYQGIWSGTDLYQLAFNKGGITFWNLQTLDHQENPQLYCKFPDAAGEYSLPQFQEEEEREVEVEVEVEKHQIEGEGSQPPLQSIQGSDLELTHSNYILDSENTLQSISITSEMNPFNQEWEECVESQVDTVFNLPKTP